MEMEISKLRVEFERSSSQLSTVQAELTAAEEKVKSSERAQTALQSQNDDLRKQLEEGSQKLISESEARAAAESKAKSLEETLESQIAKTKKLEVSVASWEKDHKTLKHLYTQADTTAQESQKKAATLERENGDLSRQVSELREKCNKLVSENAKLKDLVDNHQFESRRGTGSMQADDDELDVLEADERRKLQRKVEDLQRSLQEERRKSQQSERPRGGSHSGHRRDVSGVGGFKEVEFLGNYPPVVDEDGFLPSDDEDHVHGHPHHHSGYNQQQNEYEMKMAREQRIAELKGELMKWKGYRLDLTLVGGNPAAMGEMFEV